MNALLVLACFSKPRSGLGESALVIVMATWGVVVLALRWAA